MTDLKAIPDYGDLFTFEEFKADVDSTAIVNSDGMGFYATATHFDHDLDASPRKIRNGERPPTGFTHVMWFNK